MQSTKFTTNLQLKRANLNDMCTFKLEIDKCKLKNT